MVARLKCPARLASGGRSGLLAGLPAAGAGGRKIGDRFVIGHLKNDDLDAEPKHHMICFDRHQGPAVEPFVFLDAHHLAPPSG